MRLRSAFRLLVAVAALAGAAYTGLADRGPPGREAPTPVAAATAGIRLADHEARAGSRQGGHTIERHVGRTEAQLRQRLEEEPDISAASSFETVEQAERFIGRALDRNKAAIDAWMGSAREGDREAFDYSAGEVVGFGVVRSTGRLTQMRRLRVVLKLERYNGRPYYILTAYPTP